MNRYNSGKVIIEQIVDKTTPMDAKSLSFLNCTAIIAPLVALGIESRKKMVYLMVDAIGKYATKNITTKDIPMSFTAVAIYAHLSAKSCLKLIFASRIPITNIESGVTIFDRKVKLAINLLKIL